MLNGSDIWFVYDGECPLCKMGASLYKIKQSVGRLHVIDARTEQHHSIIQEINKAHLSIDEGMVIKYEGHLFQGAEALKVMAELSGNSGAFNRLNSFLFRKKWAAVICYPLMKLGRNIALKTKGVGPVNNLIGL